jgi:Fic family protein
MPLPLRSRPRAVDTFMARGRPRRPQDAPSAVPLAAFRRVSIAKPAPLPANFGTTSQSPDRPTMKIPQTPPAYTDLLAGVFTPEIWARIQELGLHSPTTPEGRYVHWDRLRRYPAPDGVSTKMWWAALKLARASTLKPFSLLDKRGVPFQVGTPDELQRRTSEIDRDLSGRLSLPNELASEATRDRYMVSALIEEAITSSQLEGAATTADVAREMLRSQRKPRDQSERMIYNNFSAMQFVREVADQPLTPALVCRVHAVVSEGTLPDGAEPGRLRESNDIVVRSDQGLVLHHPPEYSELAARMSEMCDFANSKAPQHFLHPAVRATLLHFWLGYDHPFPDGNGRTARALAYWSMLNSGYWLFQFISISHILRRAPAKYARSYLYSETDDNDATYFVLYQLRVVQNGITALHEYIRLKARELHDTRRMMRRSQDFNHRQLAVLSNALTDPYATYSVRSHANSHRVTRQTARTDLNLLVDAGYLVSHHAGRGKLYHPSTDIESRLKSIGH